MFIICTFRKASRSVIDCWLVAHSVSQPPTVAGAVPGVSVSNASGVTALVTATGNIVATVLQGAGDQSAAQVSTIRSSCNAL